jgi:hypothetical protein
MNDALSRESPVAGRKDKQRAFSGSMHWRGYFVGPTSPASTLPTATAGATGLASATLTTISWYNTECPDGTVSNQGGGTCVGHL